MTKLLPSSRTLVDLADRSLATFAQAFLGAVTLGHITDLGALKLGAVAGAYAVAKFALVKANAYLSRPEAPTGA